MVPKIDVATTVATEKVSSTSFFGGLEILEPESDISMDDGSTSRFTMTSETTGSKASVGNLFFRVDDMDGAFPKDSDTVEKTSSNSLKKTSTKGTISPSTSSESTPKRSSFRNLMSRSKATSFDAALKPKDPVLKRKAESWFKTRRGSSGEKRAKYRSFSNDGRDDGFGEEYQDLFASKKHTSNVQREVKSPQRESAPTRIMKKGAYDTRPIITNLFHGNDHDESFHRDRKLGDPLLKEETAQAVRVLNSEDRNPPITLDSSAIDRPRETTEERDISLPFRANFDTSDASPKFHAKDPYGMNAPRHGEILYPTMHEHSDHESQFSDTPSEEKPLLKPSFFTFCGCRPKRTKRQSKRNNRRRTAATAKRSNRGTISQKTSTPDTSNVEKFQVVANVIQTPTKKRPLFDEETLAKEMRQLDLLASEFQRESPQLLQMPVKSQLSAITEVDEDATRASSQSLSACSSIEQSGHLRNLLDTDSHGHEEEPNLFAIVAAPMESEEVVPRAEFQEPDQHDKMGVLPKEAFEAPVNAMISKEKLSNEKRRRVKNPSLKGEEILFDSKSDEDSSGGISDITEEFLTIPASSPLFNKAMAMFREMEDEKVTKSTEIEESRDDLDGLKPLVNLEI
ncbi:MAG: hypothetical protein SGILL_000731 [Bacillariaceae sp.]